MPEKEPSEKVSIHEQLKRKIGVIGSKKFHGRELGCSLSTNIFDFIRVRESDNVEVERFLIIFYAFGRRNYYDRIEARNRETDFYPMNQTEEDVREVFRNDLENNLLPRFSQLQFQRGEDLHYFTYTPICVEVTDHNAIKEIEELVQIAAEEGTRDEIMIKNAEDIGSILERIEIDNNLGLD
jgi:hypothetical protein